MINITGKYTISNFMQMKHVIQKEHFRDARAAQSVKHPTLAHVMILWFMGSSPELGLVLTAQSLEPDSDSLSPSLSDPIPLTLCLSLKNKYTVKNSKRTFS